MKRHFAVSLGVAGAVVMASLAPMAAASTKSAKLAPANNFFAGKTVNLISSVPAGSDISFRAAAPYIGKYLRATVHVVDMPGAGQLLAWNYVAKAKPTGLTIGDMFIQGALANAWEKVPGQNFNLKALSYLGFDGSALGQKVIFSVNSNKYPITNIFTLLKDRKVEVKALGSIGDVSIPLLMRVYHVPYVDLTNYSDSNAELTGLLRGDGQLSSKPYSSSWMSYVTSGKGKVLLALTFRSHWSVNPSVPTLATVLKRLPVSKTAAAAIAADATALDAGWGLFGPAGIASSKMTLLQAAVKYAVAQPGFVSEMKKAQSPSGPYTSPAQEQTSINAGLRASTVATLRKFIPLSTGVAS